MPTSTWQKLMANSTWFQGEGNYPIKAYSEFVPAPRPACKPYRPKDAPPRVGADGWRISAYEEAFELRPGLERIGNRLVNCLAKFARGQSGHGLTPGHRVDNPYWPVNLAEGAKHLKNERFVLLMPLALSRSQDDKGRIRWTLFGNSEQGPSKAFWKSFAGKPEAALTFLCNLLRTAFGENISNPNELARAGFRILPDGKPILPHWQEERLPPWTKPFLWTKSQPVKQVKYLLTFRPFGDLPEDIQLAYLAGSLHLLPYPGSLIFWGVPTFHHLAKELPLALQIPLLDLLPRYEKWPSVRVPQSGWLREGKQGDDSNGNGHGTLRPTYKRSHRWEKVHRYEDELAVSPAEDKVTHVLFSTEADHLGLYGKPMALNSQIWTKDFRLLLDGPRASSKELIAAAAALRGEGSFGYRFQFPAMTVGRHEIYWQRPLVACLPHGADQATILHDGPKGYLTAYDVDHPDLAHPLELHPVEDGDPYRIAAASVGLDRRPQYHELETVQNLRKLHETFHLRGKRKLPRSFARRLLTLPANTTLDQWLVNLPFRIADRETEQFLVPAVHDLLEDEAPPPPAKPLPSLTYDQTAHRPFEQAYWKMIAKLATGRFVNKDNADCIQDPVTQASLQRHVRDLEALGDYLLAYYTKLIADRGMTRQAFAGEIPFKWETDFDYPWMGGWLANHMGKAYERDLIVVIPGRDRSRAVIMGDHYDTAYMVDRYDKTYGGNGARLAASGADDNHSATVALMLGAPIFMDLSLQGKLDCDIWLIHLTGEEFPSDCMGARALTQRVVERTLKAHLIGGKKRDLSKVTVQGVYVLDMIAHNNDTARDIFQIAPGASAASMWLAYQAHMANYTWNQNVVFWNRKPSRIGKGRSERSPYPDKMPTTAAHLALSGEVRPPYTPRSTLYNTDGQIFSDAGIPVVLFMENYDINRTGYHDTHDTMENIDLDYGAALAAITIESVARAATERARG